MEATFDYIVVGGGSAGCVIAGRLSEIPEARVLLLEAGPSDSSAYFHMPAGFFKLFRKANNPYAFNYATTAALGTSGRTMALRQGKVLGGGSSINAMVCTRGCRADYDRWATEEGCPGWSFDEVLPLFRGIEDNDTFADEFHGIGGPLGVSAPTSPSLLSKAFVQACQQAGLPFNPDFNGRRQEGAGLYQLTQRGGRRSSSAAAFLFTAKGRQNLTIVTEAQAEKINIERGRATGVRYRHRGAVHVARVEAEIIVSSGAIGSPKLLMLSGVGPSAHLRSCGIAVTNDLPGVGQNLHDHLNVDIVYELNGPWSLERYAKPHMQVWAGLEYYLFGKGPVTSNIAEAGAFWYADPSSAQPDLQFHFMLGANIQPGTPPLKGKWGCTLDSYYARPRSRGAVTLQSSDPAASPAIDPAYLSDPHDLEMSINGVERCREIMAQPALGKYLRNEHFPSGAARTRDEIGHFIRQFGRTAHHPAGTCRMGSDDLAVVDPQLRVRGVDGLRVADSSIMPSLPNSNTNFPCMMIGEKLSLLVGGNR